jgi:imidazolonepropionase-like amidohydrolase
MKPVPVALLALLISCSHAVAADARPEADAQIAIAIVNVNVVPMDRERIIPSQTVMIENGRITAIGSAAAIPIPAGTRQIDGTNKYLLPGLIDMHVHIRSKELASYLAGGITTVRNMWGYEELVPIMRDVDTGARKGPRIFSLSAGFDGSPAQWPYTQISDDPAVVRGLIDKQYELGFREIMVYQKLSRAAYDTIVTVAREKGMTLAGHMPPLVGLEHVLASGQRSIEHLGGYAVGPQLNSQIQSTLKAGTYNCPTLAIQADLSPSLVANRRTIVAAMHSAGVRLLVGTDSGIDVTIPGSSIHDELAQFVAAGLTPYEALLGATVTAAEYLGKSSDIGTIEVGKRADAILLRSNPLTDIRRTRAIDAVIYNGRLLN